MSSPRVVTKKPQKVSKNKACPKVRSCLKAFICAQTGRPSEACDALEEMCQGAVGDKPFPLPLEAVEAVTSAVEEDAGTVLNRRLGTILQRLSDFCVITPTTVKDLITSEITVDKQMKRRRDANVARYAKRFPDRVATL